MNRYPLFLLTILILVLGDTISLLPFTTIDPPGSIFTDAPSINEPGQIAGKFEDSNGVQHGFLAVP